MICKICLRDMRLTKHHLIPVSRHKNKKVKSSFTKEERHATIDICRECHNQIHALISEKDMAAEFNTFEKLIGHEEVAKYLKWVREKSPGSKIKVSKPQRRRQKF